MRGSSRLSVVIAVVGLVASVMGPAAAGPSVAVTGATLEGSNATVTGTTSFPPITAPQSVGGVNTAFSNPTVADAVGLNLTDAQIVPLANGSGLRFIWTLAAMPPQVPPEGIRYTWAFTIGTRMYQLQAKRTNLVSVSTYEDPHGHSQQALAQREFFQLRGACVPSYLGTPANGCYHLAFLNGSFNVEQKTVQMDLPYMTKDAIGRLVAPDFVPGVTLRDNGGTNTAGMSIAASLQAVVSNTTSSEYINGWSPYFVGPQVHLAVGPEDVDPAEIADWVPATLGSNGTFSGTVTGLTDDNTTVHVRACNGTECAYAQRTVR